MRALVFACEDLLERSERAVGQKFRSKATVVLARGSVDRGARGDRIERLALEHTISTSARFGLGSGTRDSARGDSRAGIGWCDFFAALQTWRSPPQHCHLDRHWT